MAKIQCIDVSYAQGNIDFKKVKAAGVKAVIIRAGYGSSASQKDDYFEKNYKNARAVGLRIGAYWYSYAGWGGVDPVTDAKREALACLSCLKGKRFELPIYYDLEESSKPNIPAYGKKTCTKIAQVFCDEIKKGGFVPGVYSNLNWFRNYLDYAALKKKYSIWYAQWNATCEMKCDIWQNSSNGRVSGISGNVDTDVIFNEKLLSGDSSSGSSDQKKPSAAAPVAIYRVKAGGKWLPAVKNLEDFAGIRGKTITDFALKVSEGAVKYRVHVKGGKWLPYVKGYDISDFDHGYAGNGKPIDAISIDYVNKSGKKADLKYRVSPLDQGFFPWQSGEETKNGQDGYAGKFSRAIDRVQVTLG